jgi:hypothetical protein
MRVTRSRCTCSRSCSFATDLSNVPAEVPYLRADPIEAARWRLRIGRWLLGRDDSPWYPSTRLFRQTRAGDWREVVERVAAALAERVKRGR